MTGGAKAYHTCRLLIQKGGGRTVTYQMTWQLLDPDGRQVVRKWPLYRVDPASIREATDRIRKGFDAFATSVIDNDCDTQVPLLETLVAAGTAMYEVLLPQPGGEDGTNGFRPWFEENVARLGDAASDPEYTIEVVIVGKADEVPPVGLIFTPRPGRKTPATLDFDAYRDFWSIGLRCACFTSAQAEKLLDEPIDGDKFHTIVLHEHNDRSYELVEKFVKETSQPFGMPQRVDSDFVKAADRLPSAFQDSGVLIHFDLTATDRSDELNIFTTPDNRIKLSPAALEQIIEVARKKSNGGGERAYALAIIDREAIIRGDRGPKWLEIFLSRPWIGLIAVEGDARSRRDWNEDKQIRPDRFLGLVFLRTILKYNDQRMIDSIIDARRECWPFSLFYGLYCDPRQPWIREQPDLVKDIDRIIPVLGEHHPGAKVDQAVTGRG